LPKQHQSFMSVNTPIKEDLIQEQILQAAKQLFAVHGFAKVTMDDVAKAIGKGRSSLYYYYKSKDEIFDAVINIEIKETLAAMEQAVGQAATIEEKINAFFVTRLRVRRERGSFYDAMEAGMDADAMSNFNKTKIVYHDQIMKREGVLLTQILNEGIEKDELKVIGKDDMNTLIFILLSTLHGLKREMRMENNIRKIEPAVDQLTRMIMHGLYK
jgi:AcrR family transcriptional regulator